VEGALTGDREMIHRAVQMDPLTSALLPLSTIREMVDKLFTAEAEYLPQFQGSGKGRAAGSKVNGRSGANGQAKGNRTSGRLQVSAPAP